MAEKIDGEIISADSMQIWKGLEIGTAKPTAEERRRVRFHLLDVVDYRQAFSVARFQQIACDAVADIIKRGKAVILVGGTGLYVRAVVDKLEFPPQADPLIRSRLKMAVKRYGVEHLYERLMTVDRVTAERLSKADAQRITRALEVYEQTGKTLSSFHGQRNNEQNAWRQFGLSFPVDSLVERINTRVDAMMHHGLEREVRKLYARGFNPCLQSAHALGYHEILEYIEGRTNLEDAVMAIKINTRRYAKRQRTWFRSDPRIEWLNADTASTEQLACKIAAEVLQGKDSKCPTKTGNVFKLGQGEP